MRTLRISAAAKEKRGAATVFRLNGKVPMCDITRRSHVLLRRCGYALETSVRCSSSRGLRSGGSANSTVVTAASYAPVALNADF
jgi:hypothetical protein